MDADAVLAVLDELDAHGVPFNKLIGSDIDSPDNDRIFSDEEEVLDAALLGEESSLSEKEWSNGSDSDEVAAVKREGFDGRWAGGHRDHGGHVRGRAKGERGQGVK